MSGGVGARDETTFPAKWKTHSRTMRALPRIVDVRINPISAIPSREARPPSVERLSLAKPRAKREIAISWPR
jgi:hypothetical protein